MLLELNNKLLAQLINSAPKKAATNGVKSQTNASHDAYTVKIVAGKYPPKRTAKDNATMYRGETFLEGRKVFTSVYISDVHANGQTFEPETILSIKGRLELDDRGYYTLWTDSIERDDSDAALQSNVDVADEMEDVPF